MGLGSIVKTITGSEGASAARRAGRVSVKSKKQALAELEKIPGLLAPITEAYQEAYDPYAALGTEYLPQMQAAASPAGYSARLDEIMNTSTFAPLLAKRMEAGQTQMANLGLSRSGAALREATAIPTELAMQMENQLYGRMAPLFNTGIAATEARLAGTTGVQQQLAQMPIMRGNVMIGIGQDQSQAILGAAQARSQAIQSLMNAGASAYGASQYGAAAASDRRLKSDIKLKGYMSSGLPFYEYTIFGKRETGVMAQEVLDVFPDAVIQHESGYLMVDYSRIY